MIKRIASIISLGVVIVSCSEPVKQNTNNQAVGDELQVESIDSVKSSKIRKVFYTLPSPMELSVLFEKEGVQYHADLLHAVSKRKEYSSLVKKAMNVGVYGADLSYSCLFSKHEAAIKYYAASQLLAEDLGIGKAFRNRFIERLESSPGNKDTLIVVVSEFFAEEEFYLKESTEQDVSTFVLLGGWIEGMYLGTSIKDEEANAKGVKDIIFNQKASIHGIIYLLQNTEITPEITSLLDDLGKLEALYQRLEESPTDNQFNEIKRAVRQIRTSITAV